VIRKPLYQFEVLKLWRIWELRHNPTACVALVEALEARLAQAPYHNAVVELYR
jgi:hypothetical protein